MWSKSKMPLMEADQRSLYVGHANMAGLLI